MIIDLKDNINFLITLLMIDLNDNINVLIMFLIMDLNDDFNVIDGNVGAPRNARDTKEVIALAGRRVDWN